MGSIVTIQMPLRGEGVQAWRPVPSRPLGGDLFLVDVPSIPDTEDWAFAPGDIVRCLDRNFPDGSVYPTAVAQVPEESETISRELELHDSTLQRIEGGPGTIEIHLLGYVHQWETRSGIRVGLGLHQSILVRVYGADLPAALDFPVDIADGTLIGGGTIYSNVIPLPLRTSGSIRLTLELGDGSIFDVSGTECEVETSGTAEFIEVLPADFDSGARLTNGARHWF